MFSSFVPLSSRKTGHYILRRKGALCRPVFTTKEKQSPVIACHQIENTDLKCRIEGGHGSAHCKPVKDAGSIHLPKKCRAYQSGEVMLGVDSLELDMTHTKEWRVKRLSCRWPSEGKRWGSALTAWRSNLLISDSLSVWNQGNSPHSLHEQRFKPSGLGL